MSTSDGHSQNKSREPETAEQRHRRRLLENATLSFADKMQWLEDEQRRVEALERAGLRETSDVPDPDR